MGKIDLIATGIRKIDNVDYVEYNSFLEIIDLMNKKADEFISENEKLREELERLKKESGELEKQNTDIQENHMKLYNDSKDEIRQLKAEIQRMKGECGGNCSDEQDLEDEVDFEELVYELQEQHQQDCIRINNLTTTISVLSGLYTNLRKNAGMD